MNMPVRITVVLLLMLAIATLGIQRDWWSWRSTEIVVPLFVVYVAAELIIRSVWRRRVGS